MEKRTGKKICIRFSLGRQSMCTVNGGVTCKRFRWAGLTMWSMSCNRIHEKRLDALLGFGAAHWANAQNRFVFCMICKYDDERKNNRQQQHAHTEAHTTGCSATNAPISFSFFHRMSKHTTKSRKKSLLWTCCFDFVCVYFFLFLSLLHSPFFCVFELAFAIQSMRFPFVYLVFRMRFMCFKMKWARSMPPRAHFYSARKTPFSQTTVFPRGCRTVFCVEIWQKLNGSSELNWSILHNTARYRLLI